MPRGGRRDNQTGRPHSGAAKAREWLRELCADPSRRELVAKAIDAALAAGNSDPYFKAFLHGHGNPPQSLDVRHGSLDGDTIQFKCEFAEGGNAGPPSALPLPTDSTGGPQS